MQVRHQLVAVLAPCVPLPCAHVATFKWFPCLYLTLNFRLPHGGFASASSQTSPLKSWEQRQQSLFPSLPTAAVATVAASELPIGLGTLPPLSPSSADRSQVEHMDKCIRMQADHHNFCCRQMKFQIINMRETFSHRTTSSSPYTSPLASPSLCVYKNQEEAPRARKQMPQWLVVWLLYQIGTD